LHCEFGSLPPVNGRCPPETFVSPAWQYRAERRVEPTMFNRHKQLRAFFAPNV